MSNSNSPTKRRPWPEKRRRMQAENCRETKPWRRSTGPKTADGKEAAARNAYKHGADSAEFALIRAVLAAQRRYLRHIEEVEEIEEEVSFDLLQTTHQDKRR